MEMKHEWILAFSFEPLKFKKKKYRKRSRIWTEDSISSKQKDNETCKKTLYIDLQSFRKEMGQQYSVIRILQHSYSIQCEEPAGDFRERNFFVFCRIKWKTGEMPSISNTSHLNK